MRVVILLAVVFLLSSVPQSVNSKEPGVSDRRFARLTRGVNLPHWFWAIWEEDKSTEAYFRTYFTEKDAQLLREYQFRHVRLPVDIHYLFDWNQPDVLIPDYLPSLQAAIELLLAHDLSVIVVPFGSLDTIISDGHIPQAVQFWRLFAEFLSPFDAERVFLQVANEPEGDDPVRWAQLQEQLFAVMREAAPDHTFISAITLQYGPDQWGTPEALASTIPSRDPNVVYGLHFYEPAIFTLQGAEWTGWFQYLSEIPYPSSSDAVTRAIALSKTRISDPALAWIPEEIQTYGDERWDANKLEARLSIVIQWANQHGVRLIVDEFGVYRENQVSADDRNAWLYDVRTILEKHEVGWTLWDYSAGFGLVVEDWNTGQRRRKVDLATAKALGLRLSDVLPPTRRMFRQSELPK